MDGPKKASESARGSALPLKQCGLVCASRVTPFCSTGMRAQPYVIHRTHAAMLPPSASCVEESSVPKCNGWGSQQVQTTNGNACGKPPPSVLSIGQIVPMYC